MHARDTPTRAPPLPGVIDTWPPKVQTRWHKQYSMAPFLVSARPSKRWIRFALQHGMVPDPAFSVLATRNDRI